MIAVVSEYKNSGNVIVCTVWDIVSCDICVNGSALSVSLCAFLSFTISLAYVYVALCNSAIV